MASMLGPGATVAELEEELLYFQVLISSLDTYADDYESRLKELQEQYDELEKRLAHNMEQNNVANESDTSSSAAGPASAGTKRSAPSSFSSNDSPKRLTPSPSSQQSGYAASQKANADRAMLRQRAAEAAIQRQRDSIQADAEFARRLSQNHQHQTTVAGPSRPSYQAVLNPTGGITAPPRPAPVLPPQMPATPQPVIKAEPQRHSSYLNTQAVADSDIVDLTADSDGEDFNTTMSNVRPVQRPAEPTTQLPSFSQISRMPGQWPTQSVTPNPVQPMTSLNRQPYSQQQSYAGQVYPSTQPVLPGNWQHPAFQPAMQYQAPGFSTQLPHHLSSQSGNFNRVSNEAGALANVDQQLRNLFNTGSSSNPFPLDYDDEDASDDSLVYQGQSSRPGPAYNPYAGREDLYRSRYEMLESYNPEKTKEELNALLNNIRPDEDLPDHLLVQTPEAMAVKLHKYQELGLTWLKRCEEGTNKGGILADDMGLGKTIQMLSLMVTRKSDDQRCKTTLIVAPVALLRQWKQEIEQRVKRGRHSLTVHIHHGSQKKTSAHDLMLFDVVLTTFGSLAAELRRREAFAIRANHDPSARPNKSERCALIDPDAKWYRVILDEAQCIKNKTTLSARAAYMVNAKYRFCMTGTPMMNNVDEFYSLIKFLRIKPYDSWEKFRTDLSQPLKRGHEGSREKAMRMLQALCKAVMLRRTKKSEYHGQPILVLPERTNGTEHAVFDKDEKQIYEALEQRTQVTFNKYLRAGSVGRSYSAILVLLLRLRQACCHPHLIKDFSIAAAADMTETQLVDLARELSDQAITRIKETNGNFECPICMDACVNPAIFLPCGHDTCRDCYIKLADPNAALQQGSEGAVKARCPHCRQDIDPKRITDFLSFKRVHMPELLTPEEKEQFAALDEGDADDDESTTESDDDETESEDDKDDTLGGFIVRDEEDIETESEADEADAADELEEAEASSTGKKRQSKTSTSNTKSKSGKGKAAAKKKGKGKGKAKEKPKKKATQLTLAELKKQATRNVKFQKMYLKRLRESYTDSAKIRKLVEILNGIMESAENEKVLVFSQWTSLLDLCEVEISGKGWGYRRYDGSMNAKMRGDAVDDFKDARQNVRIMMVSLKAGNAGLNLNVASQVIILDPFWNPYIEEQAIDRAHRIGQVRPVRVHRILVESTVEDRICELQEKKRRLIEQALDEREASQLSRLGAQELAYLFGVTNSLTARLPAAN